MENKDVNQHFFGLITMFASATWQHLGKIPSQMDGKISTDLKAAQMTIDVLLMLRDKTKGNLTPKEESMLTETISSLQLNYADEAAKPKSEPPKVEEKKESCGCKDEKKEEKCEDKKESCGCKH